MDNMLARFEVLTALTVSITSLPYVTPCSLIKEIQSFCGNSYRHSSG